MGAEYKAACDRLPGKIKVRVNEDRFGGVTLTPVSERIKRLVSATNQYNGSYDVYFQNEDDIIWLMANYPKTRYRTNDDYDYKIGRYRYAINDNNVFLIDSWDYRHMVGGQSD
jgi:hypothetical protein